MPAGTGQSEPNVTQIRKLEERLDNFRIQVSDDLTIRGNAWQGYALNVPECPGDVLGACCVGSECHVVTAQQCAAIGGTFFGGPCDPSPCETPACPTSITFNGIEFCCACDGGGGFLQFYEDPMLGVVNDVAWELPVDGTFNDCTHVCFNNGQFPGVDGIFLPVLDNGDHCPSEGDFAGVLSLTVFVSFIAGVWTVLLVVEGGFIFFYGTSADPSSISNDITGCSLDPVTWDNTLVDCINSGPFPYCQVAKSGTAALTF